MINSGIKALVGRDGYLFLDNDTNHVIKQISGDLLLTNRQVYLWKNLLLSRYLHAKYRGIYYKFIIPPNKEVVYKDFLPDHVKFSNFRPVTQIIDSLNNIADIVYYRDHGFDLSYSHFPKGETHWTDTFAYEYVWSAIDFPGASPLTQEAIEICSKTPGWFDLGSIVKNGYTEEILCLKPKSSISKLIYTNGINNTGRIDIFEGSDKSLPKVLVFRDSFFTNLLELFSESFSQVVYIWHPWVDWEQVDKYKPDIVLNCSVERFLVTLPNDIAGPSWEELSKSKLS